MIKIELILIFAVILFIVILIIEKLITNSKIFPYSYKLKSSLLTNTELKYYNALKSILSGSPYVLQPQVCLSSIIERNEKHKYQSELSRIVDFCVFSPEYSPILLIEINDKTHLTKDRKDRDKKVKYILKSAKIPLVTLWTTDEFDIMSIAKTLKNNGLKIDLGSIYNGIH